MENKNEKMKQKETAKDKAQIIRENKAIENVNEENIKVTIDYISIRLSSDKTKEYIDFNKDVRNLKRTIYKKKEELLKENMLEESYFTKDSCIIESFEIKKNEYEKVGKYIEPELQNGKFLGSEYTALELAYLSNEAIKKKQYPNTILADSRRSIKTYARQGGITDKDCTKFYTDARLVLASKRIIQDGNAVVNAILMNEILEYYENELEYWDSCLEKIKELDEIREFE